MKIAIAVVLGLASLGLFGVAFAETSSLRKPAQLAAISAVDVPAFPDGASFRATDARAPEGKSAAARPADPKPVDAKPADAKPTEARPIAAKPAEPKTEEPKTEEPKAAEPKAAEAKTAEPKPVAAKPAEPRPTEAKAAEPKPVATKPTEPKAAARPEVAEAAPAAAPGSSDAMLNLRASDTADVFVDGKKAGQSPALGYKVKPGKHKVRFDCYEASGATQKGPEKVVEVRAMEEKDVEYECTAEAKAPAHDESPY